MKPDHTTRGILFIALCMLAGFAIYMFVWRNASHEAEVTAENMTGENVQAAAPDIAEDQEEPSIDDADTAAPFADEAAPEGMTGETEDRAPADGVATDPGPTLAQTPCSGSWSNERGGAANMTFYPGLSGTGMVEVQDGGELLGRSKYWMADVNAVEFTVNKSLFRLLCRNEVAEIVIIHADGSRSVGDVYLVAN